MLEYSLNKSNNLINDLLTLAKPKWYTWYTQNGMLKMVYKMVYILVYQMPTYPYSLGPHPQTIDTLIALLVRSPRLVLITRFS